MVLLPELLNHHRLGRIQPTFRSLILEWIDWNLHTLHFTPRLNPAMHALAKLGPTLYPNKFFTD